MQPTLYKNYLLSLLTAILVFNYVDRLALGVLLQDIKSDLQLSDTQLGFLGGIAFALFYSVMGIPIARWADRGYRVVVIVVTTLLWTVAVALCGVAASFSQLLLVRIAVAVGEAGCIPPAFALIAAYFPRAERPRATAIYGMGGGIAAVIGYFCAGWLNELYGWRATFAIIAAPGLLLAPVAWFTLKEPPRESQQALPAGAEHAVSASFSEVFATLWASRTFRHLLFCLAISFFFTYGLLQWQPAFFLRSHGLTSGQLGSWLTASFAFATLAGTYLGGEVASRHAGGNEALQLKGMAAAVLVSGVFAAAVYLVPNHQFAFACLALAYTLLGTLNGPLFATIQTLVPQSMRATSFALVYLFANLIGMGFGPLAAGVLSDALRPWAGPESLRYALVALTPGYVWVAWHAWCASRTVAGDLARARAASIEPTEQQPQPGDANSGTRDVQSSNRAC